MIGAGLLLPVQTPALAKTSYKVQKYKRFKAHKIKGRKMKTVKAINRKVPKHR